MSFFLDEETGKKHAIFGEGGGKRLAEESNVPYLGGIPLSPVICRCGDQGRSIYVEAAPSIVKDAFLSIAQAIADSCSKKDENRGAGMLNFELQWEDM
jgi:ATP-binding protein involved in chromosome partitioning